MAKFVKYWSDSPYQKDYSYREKFVDGKLTAWGCYLRHRTPRHAQSNEWKQRAIDRARERGY